MRFLINCSNLKNGGGLQVADSICGLLNRYPQHQFFVVLSDYLELTLKRIKDFDNVKVVLYTIPNNFKTIVLGRDNILDQLVNREHIDAVLTVFGPSRWCPRIPHLSGFALPQLVIPESPYFSRMEKLERLKWKLWCKIRKWSLKRSANCFWTENEYITRRLKKILKTDAVYTVSNYYNQIFDTTDKWQRSVFLPSCKGITLLTISSTGSHKNLGIMVPIADYLEKVYHNFEFRFVLTCEETPFHIPKHLTKHFMLVGKVDVSECPNLYEQADIMFLPTLLECFTATYPEAMRMEVPIVTTDLEFARGLCGEAACYYSAVDVKAAAEAIYKVATDKEYAQKLVAAGKEQLKQFDNYEQRADKLVHILEEIMQL